MQMSAAWKREFEDNFYLRSAIRACNSFGVADPCCLERAVPRRGQVVPDREFLHSCYNEALRARKIAEHNSRGSLQDRLSKKKFLLRPHDYPDEITAEYLKKYRPEKLKWVENPNDEDFPLMGGHKISNAALKQSSRGHAGPMDYDLAAKSHARPLTEKEAQILYGPSGTAEYFGRTHRVVSGDYPK